MSFMKQGQPLSQLNQPKSRMRRSKYRFTRRFEAVFTLRIVWSLVIIWFEWIHFNRSISRCRWPSDHLPKSHPSGSTPFNVLIIADPQLPSISYSYPTRILPLRWLSIKIIDQFIRKSWKLLIQNTHPDAIVFLGDLLDGGIAARDPIQFQNYVNRFYRTFPIPKHILSSEYPTNHSPHLIHLVGNHDVGLYPSTSVENSTNARERFKKHWSPGQLNGQVEWGNHTIVWLDALSFIEEGKSRASGTIGENDGEVTRFINGLDGPEMLLPKVLFTHVPLWRAEGTSCGPFRESRRNIRQGAGVNYQNEIPEIGTTMILNKVQPSLIFSGDDHDYCEVVHTLPSNSLANPLPLSIPEISVKSFSMGMGVQNPGYQLLTLFNPARFGRAPDEQTAFHKPCFLPNQIQIYTHVYLPLFVISVMILFGPPFWKSIKKSRAVTRNQAKTNGLPIHNRTHRHRNSLPRALMFTKTTSGGASSSYSSSEEDNRSDEESNERAVNNRVRRSMSLGLGIGLGLEGGEGFNSPGMLSYHSPVDSGHDDERFSQPSPALGLDMSKMRRSIDTGGELTNYPPSHPHFGKSLSSRFQTADSLPSARNSAHQDRTLFKLIRLLAGRSLSNRLERYLMQKGILSSKNPSTLYRPLSGHRNRSSKGSFRIAFVKLFQLLWVIFLVYFLILKWFDW